MTFDEEVYLIAVSNGCKPFWWKPYKAWCCGCKRLTHICDQQCSAISLESAARRDEGDAPK